MILPLLHISPTINQPGMEKSDIDDWKAHGFKELCHWGFLNELPRGASAGRPKLVEGYECAGQKYFYDLESMTLHLE